jgi:hypothetical protein
MHQFVNNRLSSSFVNTQTTNAARREENDGPVLHIASDFLFPVLTFPQQKNILSSRSRELGMNLIGKKLKLHPPNSISTDYSNIFLGKLEENYVCERLLCPHCHL